MRVIPFNPLTVIPADRNSLALQTSRTIHESAILSMDFKDGKEPSKSAYFTVVNKCVFRGEFGELLPDCRKYVRTIYTLFAQCKGNVQEQFADLDLTIMNIVQTGFYETPTGLRELHSYIIGFRDGEATSVIQGFDRETGMYNVTGMNYPLLEPDQFYPTTGQFSIDRLYALKDALLKGGSLLGPTTKYITTGDAEKDMEMDFDEEDYPVGMTPIVTRRMTFDESVLLRDIPITLLINNIIPMVDSMVIIFDSKRGVNFRKVLPSFNEAKEIVLNDMVRVGNQLTELGNKMHKFFGTIRIYYYHSTSKDYIWLVKRDQNRIVRLEIDKGDEVDSFLVYHETRVDDIIRHYAPD